MLDLRTLLVLMATADLMLAAALWIGANRGLRDGLGCLGAIAGGARALALVDLRAARPGRIGRARPSPGPCWHFR
jgi:hypothetical protein